MDVDAVDVLVVTAVPEEHAAVLDAGGGAAAWAVREGVAFRDVDGEGGKLRVAVVQALGMGAAQAVIAAARMLAAPGGVHCLAMCGVCAGRRGDVELGDVIVADRVWEHGAGKRKVDAAGVVAEQEDVEMFRLHPPAWKLAAERFAVDPGAAWLKLRPRSLAAQGDWILERALRGASPVNDPEQGARCPDFDRALDRLWKHELLADGSLELTEAGRKHIQRVLLRNLDRLPEPRPFRVHVGPIASGHQVVEDAEVFARLATSVRKVLGVDMEVAAIGALGWAVQAEHVVVMKGVMDHADGEKDDAFKAFAARASAECLLAFVRKHLPARGMGENILVAGTSPLPRLAGPAARLNARHEVVPFHGREDVLGELRGWCEGGDKVLMRLIHAAGGMGKTRLGIELCRQMRGKGWRAGFLKADRGLAELLESTKPVLVAIDYAESRADLRGMLGALEGRRLHKLRLLLLARNAEQWWADLVRSDGAVGDVLRGEEPVELRSVTPDREIIFREAVEAFTGAPYKGAVPSLADERYARVLYVHAAALAAAKGRAVAVDALMEDTLDHEERFWREQLRDRGHAGERKALHKMRLAVAGLTLRGGASTEAEAEALAGDEDMSVLLRDLYPGRLPMVVGGLEPDLLGEAMVWRALCNEGAGAGPYLDRVFEGAGEAVVRTGLTVLGRLSADHEEAAGWIARVLGHDVAGRVMAAFAAAKTVGERTAHAALGMELGRALEREGTAALAARLEGELPDPDRTVSLREVGRWVLATRLAALLEGLAPEEQARLLNNLSVWQSALGQREAALASNQGAVDIRRKLAASRPEAFLPNLAMSLNNLGVKQSELGQREAALASSREAVDSYRKLASSRPETFLPDLAMSLNNLGGRQSELGQREAALASSREAVDGYRKLASSRPEAFLPYLATSLNNLGMMQSALGQREAALASTQEAVDIRRKLAASRPEAFVPDLAMSLHNLGARQSEFGQREAALASTQEAVDSYRKLAASRPEAFLPVLATSLRNLGLFQSDLGQNEVALASSEEALEAIWPFYQRLPAAFAELTGNTLADLRRHLAALGRAPSPALLERIAAHEAGRGV